MRQKLEPLQMQELLYQPRCFIVLKVIQSKMVKLSSLSILLDVEMIRSQPNNDKHGI